MTHSAPVVSDGYATAEFREKKGVQDTETWGKARETEVPLRATLGRWNAFLWDQTLSIRGFNRSQLRLQSVRRVFVRTLQRRPVNTCSCMFFIFSFTSNFPWHPLLYSASDCSGQRAASISSALVDLFSFRSELKNRGAWRARQEDVRRGIRCVLCWNA